MPKRTLLTLAALAAGVPRLASQEIRLSLGDAVSRAVERAPAVALAGLRADEADARVRQARAPLLPNLSAGGAWVDRTFNRRSLGFDFPAPLPELIGPFANVDARLRLTQTLFDYAAVARVRAARAQAGSAGADREAVAEAAAAGAALAYLEAAAASARLDGRRRDSTLAADLLRLAEAQQAAGVGTPIDVTRARAQLVAATGALVVARNAVERARIRLTRAVGLDPASLVSPADTLSPDLARSASAGSREELLALAAARPDLAAERARTDAARGAARAVGAERFPRLELAADYGVNGPTLGEAIATRQIGVQVTVPIVDGLRREARRAEQEALAREAELRASDLEDEIAAQVDGALLDLESAGAQQAIAAEGLRLADEELRQARERFEAGVAGNIEVITAQAGLVRAREAEIDARRAAALARVALARAVGLARRLN